MSMYCFQCQEAAGNKGCTVRGVCGKTGETATLQDLLVYAARGLATVADALPPAQTPGDDRTLLETGRLALEALFTTVTNVSFDDARITQTIFEVLRHKEELLASALREGTVREEALTEAARWKARTPAELHARAALASVMAEEDPDKRALGELAIYGLKGIAAYADHARVLGYEDQDLYREILRLLAAVDRGEASAEIVIATGHAAVTAMALLDRANTETYGNPEITQVELGVRKNPGILISGHDLKDLHELLEQTRGSGVDVYTHGEMLPAHYYPTFKQYSHFVGNYGSSWWAQDSEFESFHGPIVMTTNCLTPPKASYRDRIFTTGLVAFPEVAHIPDRSADSPVKDFSRVIELAKTCPPPRELETGSITGGFAHAQVTALADTVVEAVKTGAISKFIVMGGCDGRQKGRSYFTDMAKALPPDTVILTAGCAKYRYNKLDLGSIGGIPRVLDAGQCNDSYSLAVIALKLKEAFGLESLEDLPLDFDIAWYEQKAITVLLALLALGFKGVRIGPTLPAFLSPAVAETLVSTFGLKVTTTVEADLAEIMGAAAGA
ncbi:hydroxylamine reductase [Alkalispirochaeta sphaeroplastigenens]|uniref:Hydroxylamine reductase n=2 Tax=Alkalispirochaeta sphaeroplastigenens TaxID=1187066 RepID=A0A2S4JX69_9SPIO|nr:hydroxylamine reductase [Alkalispirochaeta sphaeroplastigenens]